MNNIKLTLLFVFVLIFFSVSLPGQTNNTDNLNQGFKKNAVYATVGYFPLWVIANVNYERVLLENRDRFITAYIFKLGGGVYATWGVDGYVFNGGFTALTGSKNNHAELSLGVTSLNELYDISPSGSIGYRFQKPGGSFVFRTGIGFPDVLYLSFGFCF